MGDALKLVQRQFDDLPITAHLYVTAQCNLDCSYCTEYDNSQPHPTLAQLKLRIDKIAELGCIRLGIQGGEPLMHPDIVAIVAHCKLRGLNVNMATNGFRITEGILADLHRAGLDGISISIDSVNPSAASRKSLKSVSRKLDLLRQSGIAFNVAGVIFDETVEETRELLDYCVAHDIPVHARIVHAGEDGRFGVGRGDTARVESMLDYQEQLKRQGRKIKSAGLIDYQRSVLRGEPYDWECVAGYKYFFVSAKGEFWMCSMNRTPGIDILDVTPEMLRANKGRKSCQDGCGVYCIVSMSIARAKPLRFGLAEMQGWRKRKHAPVPA